MCACRVTGAREVEQSAVPAAQPHLGVITMSNRETIEVFLQGEGISEVQIVRISEQSTVQELIEKAGAIVDSSRSDAVAVLFLEDSDGELSSKVTLKDVGIGHRSRVHSHRCRRVVVTVNFKDDHKSHEFPPSATVRKVKRWADEEFELKGIDATEHALQICGTATRPDEDVHIGSLVKFPDCKICFDLVPKKRVEG